jgi:hypothetical protein
VRRGGSILRGLSIQRICWRSRRGGILLPPRWVQSKEAVDRRWMYWVREFASLLLLVLSRRGVQILRLRDLLFVGLGWCLFVCGKFVSQCSGGCGCGRKGLILRGVVVCCVLNWEMSVGLRLKDEDTTYSAYLYAQGRISPFTSLARSSGRTEWTSMVESGASWLRIKKWLIVWFLRVHESRSTDRQCRLLVAAGMEE